MSAPVPSNRKRASVLLVLAVLVPGYLLAVVLTRNVWSDTAGTRVTVAPQTPDGAPPDEAAMTRARDDVAARLAERGVSDGEVAVDGTTIVAVFPKAELAAEDVRAPFESVDRTTLHIRPLIQEVPADPGAPDPEAPADVATEMALRQSTDPVAQDRALRSHVTRCGDKDPLAGHDDPGLPLITCSADGRHAYLLDRAILGAEDVELATAGPARPEQHVVSLSFDDDAARTWQDFTADNVGTRAAFTTDTRVLAAPEIQEAMPGGLIQISADFTAESAARLADSINRAGAPGLTVESVVDETLPATRGSELLRVAVIVVGLGLAAAAVVTGLRLRRRA